MAEEDGDSDGSESNFSRSHYLRDAHHNNNVRFLRNIACTKTTMGKGQVNDVRGKVWYWRPVTVGDEYTAPFHESINYYFFPPSVYGMARAIRFCVVIIKMEIHQPTA